jgi:hypothetical protein
MNVHAYRSFGCAFCGRADANHNFRQRSVRRRRNSDLHYCNNQPRSAVGKVTFIDEHTILGTAPVSNAQATIPVRFSSPGRHAIRAVYLPSAGFAGSSADTSVLVTVTAIPRSFAARVILPGSDRLIDLNRDTLLDYMPPGALNKIDARLQNSDGSFAVVKTSDIGFGRLPLGYGDFDNNGTIDALAEECFRVGPG